MRPKSGLGLRKQARESREGEGWCAASMASQRDPTVEKLLQVSCSSGQGNKRLHQGAF